MADKTDRVVVDLRWWAQVQEQKPGHSRGRLCYMDFEGRGQLTQEQKIQTVYSLS